ncbi:MAG: tetratricopeptide repeat protein [Syntrophobacterales bacterium]|jgi:tetratricopeptide (TPR) repeat protein
MTSSKTSGNTIFTMRRDIWVCILLTIAIAVVFLQLPGHDFVNYDDDLFVYENSQVRKGLSKEGVIWALTSFSPDYWKPLSWLSHMLDCELFGLKPGMHHLVNLLFHLANSVLLLLVLNRMTGALWPSSFVAALFALHPLHVESVAWVAERKDVLSAFFWLLAVRAYSRYVERPRSRRYLLALFFFALGLMAKPMVVTLPFVLLLLDYWPLERMEINRLRVKQNEGGMARSSVFHLVWEKIPFIVLSGATTVVTIIAQRQVGALKSFEGFPFSHRIANALVSYVSYIGKMVWPHKLAVFYPYPTTIPLWQSAGAGLLLITISVLLLRAAANRPYLAVGWLWYVVTLLPVIGLVQVGVQAMADRYTYLSIIGLFIIIAWGIPSVLASWRHRKKAIALAATVLLLVFAICSMRQVSYWQDSASLFQHTNKVTINNDVAHNHLGLALAAQGRFEEAMSHYVQALRIKPREPWVHSNLGIALARQGRLAQAIDHYEEALRIKPDLAKAHNNLGNALAKQGKLEEAMSHYAEALRIKPDFEKAHNNLGNALARQGKLEEAMSHYAEALRINPDYAGAHNNLGNALAMQGKLEEAMDHYSQALRINPEDAEAHNNLGNILAAKGRLEEAANCYSEALRINPDYARAHYNLANTLAAMGRFDEAVGHYSEALRIWPDYAAARKHLELVLQLKGKLPETSGTDTRP